MLAFGAEQKGSFAAGRGRHVFMNQYIGDLKNAETRDHYRTALLGTLQLFGVQPTVLVCDLHPDYASTREAEEMGRPTASAVAADPASLGPTWLPAWRTTAWRVRCSASSGTAPAWGEDGSVWGAECLVGDYHGYRRLGSIRPVALPGGDVLCRRDRPHRPFPGNGCRVSRGGPPILPAGRV